MSELQMGENAPDFKMVTDAGDTVSLADFKGRNLVLYFYPRDDTPGCTAQACAFRDDLPQLGKLNAAVLGVSRDDTTSHGKFRDKFSLNFPLASDAEGKATEAYGVWVEKSMYGKKYRGIDRATFLIDGAGVIRRVWRKVKVAGHDAEVRDALTGLTHTA